MLQKVLELCKEFYEGEEEIDFTGDLSFMDDLEFSSLEFFSMITTLEEECGCKITEREIQRIVTVNDLVDILEDKRK